MKNLLYWLEAVEETQDTRQKGKVRHRVKDIVIINLLASLANANEWDEMEYFAKANEEYLHQYIKLENGVPSSDTIRRVMGMLDPWCIRELQNKWNELLSQGEGEKLKKVINIDGKTMRSNTRNGSKPAHIVSAWSETDGYCLGERAVEEKSNEITAIPLLLDQINIKNQVVTIDAMGTQTEIAKKIRQRHGDYVLAVKGNQPTLEQGITLYLQDMEFRKDIQNNHGYKRTVEKCHGQLEVREYYQTSEIGWLEGKSKWQGLKSIGMVEKTVTKGDRTVKERRYYISSLAEDIELFARAVREHWRIEIMHWHLDVTFREDANTTLDKNAAINQNIIRKWCLSILKMWDAHIGNRARQASLHVKRFMIGCHPGKILEEILNM